VPIGISCRICERADCPQRAFPPIDRSLVVPANERHVVPYEL
jgi:predicted transcriptional regulator